MLLSILTGEPSFNNSNAEIHTQSGLRKCNWLLFIPEANTFIATSIRRPKNIAEEGEERSQILEYEKKCYEKMFSGHAMAVENMDTERLWEFS